MAVAEYEVPLNGIAAAASNWVLSVPLFEVLLEVVEEAPLSALTLVLFSSSFACK